MFLRPITVLAGTLSGMILIAKTASVLFPSHIPPFTLGGVWVVGAMACVCAASAVAYGVSKIGVALAELEVDCHSRGPLGPRAQAAQQLAKMSFKMGMHEFNDVGLPMAHSGIKSSGAAGRELPSLSTKR